MKESTLLPHSRLSYSWRSVDLAEKEHVTPDAARALFELYSIICRCCVG